MRTTTETHETLHLTPPAGCGTLEAPWTGWEARLEQSAPEDGRTVLLAPGFYEAARPVRLGAGLTVRKDPAAEGQVWLLPAAGPPIDALLVVESRDDVHLEGLCLNGRIDRAGSGVAVRCGHNIKLENCRLEDFGTENGAAVMVEGNDQEHAVSGVVVKGCHFLSGHAGVSLGRDASDLLIADNRFEELRGPALTVDPRDQWADYGLIFVGNRARTAGTERRGAFVALRPGAEGIRIAENTFEAERAASAQDVPGLEIQGGGPLSRRRLEVLVNRLVGIGGPGLRARQCGPGFVAAGNEIVACGSAAEGALDLVACQGVLVEDNEVGEPAGPGIRAQDCSASRLNGNEVEGGSPTLSRGGSSGVLVQGGGTRRLRVTDNRIRAVREDGVRVEAGTGLRVVGNEVEDCGTGIHVERGRNLLLVGNDCRDNSQGGIRIAADVRRGVVALNYSILNGTTDLDVRGERMRLRSNKVDREGGPDAAISN